MPEMTAHPSREQLSAYNLGQLPPDEAVVVDSHISECEPCCDTIISLSSDDTFLGLLKEARQLLTDQTVIQTVTTASSSCQDVPVQLAEHPRYEILGLIGKGGMGDVYKARHRKMERTVALKVINRGLVQKPEAVDRFHREVKTAAQLSHPHIVTAHDADQADDFHFMVMEYVDGVDLSQTVKDRGALPVAEACDYIRQAAVGLQHAYECGMVHRDIKPHNLMVTSDGNVKILDFGLASLAPEAISDADTVEARGDLTAAGAIMGTPDFISPEQAEDARQADIRSDIYSLGATLYFLLAGRPPFAEGSLTQKLKSHALAEPEPLESLRDDIPAELVAVVTKMTAKDPEERFQTPAEVAKALKSLSQSVEPRKDIEPPAHAKPRRGKPNFLSITAVAVLFVAALFAGLIVFIQSDGGGVRVEVIPPEDTTSLGAHTLTIVDTSGKKPFGGTSGTRQDDASGNTTHFFESANGRYKIEIVNEVLTVNGHKYKLENPNDSIRIVDDRVEITRVEVRPKNGEPLDRASLLVGEWRGKYRADEELRLTLNSIGTFEMLIVDPARPKRVQNRATGKYVADFSVSPAHLDLDGHIIYPAFDPQREPASKSNATEGAASTTDGPEREKAVKHKFEVIVELIDANTLQMSDIEDDSRPKEFGEEALVLHRQVIAIPQIVVTDTTTIDKVQEGLTADLKLLQGIWDVIAFTQDGKKELVADKDYSMQLQVEGNTLTRIATTGTGPHAENSGRLWGRIELDSTTNPKSIDIISTDDPDDRFVGIYEFKEGALRLCYVEQSDIDVKRDRPVKRPATFDAPVGSRIELFECRRNQPKTAAERDARAIRGTWTLESTNGKPPRPKDPVGFEGGLVFGERTVRAIESTDEPPAPYRLDSTKTPKQIDILAGANKVLGIYELEADTLRIGYSGEEGKRPTSFARSDVVLTLKWKPNDSDGRRGSARFGFGDRIESLEYSRDGKRLISSGSGWGTAVWDAESGDLVRHVPEEGNYLVASMSPDGTLMATSARNARTVQVRSVETGEVVCSIDGGFRAVRFAPDGESVFTVVGNRVARFDVATGERLPAFAGVGGGSSTFAVAPKGTLVAGIASPRNMRVWDWMDVKEVASARSLRMGQGNAKDIVFTPDGKSLVLLGEKNTGADLRDARTLEVTREFPGDENKESTCVDVSEDGSRMAFGSEGGLAFVYDLKTGELVSSWRAHTGHIAAVALSPDGTRLACGTRRSGSVRIWNVETLKPVFSTDNKQQQIHSEKEGNAALMYWQAFALLPELSGEDRKLLTDLEKGSELGVDAKSLLTRSKTALSLISHLQPDMPCRWELIENGPSTLLPHLSKARMLAQLLVLQAKVDADSGKTEAAVGHLTQAFLVARHVDEGVLVQMVVGDAIESLAADVALSLLPKLDASSRGRFAEALSKLPKRTTFTQAMCHERDVFGRGAGKMMSDALEQLGKGEDLPAVRAILAGTDKRQAMWLEELLAEYDKVIEASELPLAEASKNFERIEKEVQDSTNPLIQLMVPSLVGTNQKHARVDARVAKLETRLRDAETSAGKLDGER